VAVQVVTTLVQVAMTPVRAGTTPAVQAGTIPVAQAGTTPAVQAAMDLAQVFTARQMQMDSKLVGMKPQMAFRV